MDDEQREQAISIDESIAADTFNTADNLREMGFEEAGDVFERQGD